MDKKPIDVAKDLLAELQKNPQAIDSLKSQAPAAEKPIDLAKKLIKHVQENPKDVEGLQKTLISTASVPQPEPKPNPVELANQLLKSLKENPKAIEELTKAQAKDVTPKDQRSIIKEELKSEFKPRFCKSAAPAGATLQLPKKPQPKPPQKPPIQLKSEVPADASKPAKIEAGKCCKEEYDSPERRRAMIKEELKAEWKPRFKKEEGPTMSMADQNPTAMKAQADPASKGVMSLKRIKPSDVQTAGVAGMAVPKKAMGLAPKPKMN